MTPDGGNELFIPDGQGGWKSFDKIPMEDMLTTGLVAFDKTGNVLYMIDSRGRNTAALTAVDLTTNEKKIIAEDPKADISNIMMHPVEKSIEAVAVEYLRTEWKIIDPTIQSDLEYLKSVTDGDLAERWTINFGQSPT